MDFTYLGYKKLIEKLKVGGYSISKYDDWERHNRCVILRHDADEDISKEMEMAKFEQSIGVSSTYFILLTSEFYNVFAKENFDRIKEIIKCGHTIGLHFDEARYPELGGNLEDIKSKILEEADILSNLIEVKVSVVSMHRPSKMMIDADLKIPGIINSYGGIYFKVFKYLSDSRRRWREPVEEIIDSGVYERLHILTHSFWYNEEQLDLRSSMEKFINGGNKWRWNVFNENMTDLSSVIPFEEVT